MKKLAVVVLSVAMSTLAFGQEDWSTVKIILHPSPDGSRFSGGTELPPMDRSGCVACGVTLLYPIGSRSVMISPATVEVGVRCYTSVTIQNFVWPSDVAPGTPNVVVGTYYLRWAPIWTDPWTIISECPVVMDIPPYYGPTPSHGSYPVSVYPPESTTGVKPVRVIFSSVSEPGGTTSLTISSTGESTPGGFRLGQPPMYYDVSTTATYTAPITISINYSDVTFHGALEKLRLFHWEDGHWVDCTTSVDTVAQKIYGSVNSLSPFAICEPVVHVNIDIKPGSYPNSFNKNGHGVTPVAILGSADFDVTKIDPTSLDLAGMAVKVKNNGTPQCSLEDVNEDGYADLVCQFLDDSTTWSVGTTTAVLTGSLYDGTPIEGSDEIRIVP